MQRPACPQQITIQTEEHKADSIKAVCFCSLLTPSCQSRSAKQQRRRESDLSTLHFYLIFIQSHLLSRVKLFKCSFYWDAAYAQNAIVFSFFLSFFFSPQSSNTEIICKEIIGLARTGLLHTNFVRLTSRGQCSM